MSKFSHILFDLDGTLTDPALGITNSVIYSLKKFGIEVTDRKELYSFIGPPLIDSYKERFGFDDAKAALAVEYYREYFSKTGLFENEIISGIPELLKNLTAKGKTLILATSKPLVFANRILEHFDLLKYFYKTFGSELDGRLSQKDEVIEAAIKSCNISSISNTAMVGDRKYDILGAVKNDITPVGVLFGYGDFDELKGSGSEFIASTVKELEEYLLGDKN